MAVLGTVLCLLFELVVAAPDFPSWIAMQLRLGCAALLAVHFALATDNQA